MSRSTSILSGRRCWAQLVLAVMPWTGAMLWGCSGWAGEVSPASYFELETARLAAASWEEITSAEEWNGRKDLYRSQLQEMLGLNPWPDRGELQPVITGVTEHPEFRVERIHFQSLPGLYVTGNLYLPKEPGGPWPVILYLCGHGRVAKDGVSFGNKVHYQHHGGWFARHGYACLTLDTIQLGELEGIHHGTYREGLWWWNARGYTPAGVEAWNGIRAVDYLETRPEVDTTRLGITGRSGGGAYSWWVAALDERVRVAAPVAGITDLHNHVVDGKVEGHCDCMFMVNTYQWDYAQVAALMAPRPLLIVNTDSDNIFPLDGVTRIFTKVRRLYELLGAKDQVGLVIGPGPHQDTQDLQVPVFRWFNRHLRGDVSPVARPAEPYFAPEQLKVFATLPVEERTTVIHETFVPRAPLVDPPVKHSDWEALREGWRRALREKSFAGWPTQAPRVRLTQRAEGACEGVALAVYEFASQPEVPLSLHVLYPAGVEAVRSVELTVLEDGRFLDHPRPSSSEPENMGKPVAGGDELLDYGEVTALLASGFPALFPDSRTEGEKRPAIWPALSARLAGAQAALVFVSPRGLGDRAWSVDPKDQTQTRRRFMLLGQTLDGMRVWDIRRAIQAVRTLGLSRAATIRVRGHGVMGVNVLYASLFEDGLEGLTLEALPSSHREGPDYLNVLRFLDVPQAVAMAVERQPVVMRGASERDWTFVGETARRLGWGADRWQIHP